MFDFDELEHAESSRTWPLAYLSVSDLLQRLAEGTLTSAQLVRACLDRIEALDRAPGGPELCAVIAVNPAALKEAQIADNFRASQGVAGRSLLGIPVLIKDNVDTATALAEVELLPTTAGSLALRGTRPPCDATVVQRLRAAGAVILGKANLSEWANFRSTASRSGWSAAGGQARNPHVLDRCPSGSSSGSAIAVAAGYAPLAVGTETNGSIVSPAHCCGVVGVKPTLGLVSCAGVVPISHSQDSVGIFGRSVEDAAAGFSAMACVEADGRDPQTGNAEARVPPRGDYVHALKRSGCRGARIGVLRGDFDCGLAARRGLDTAVEVARQAGAIVVDPCPMSRDFWAEEQSGAAHDLLLDEFPRDLEAYLATRVSVSGERPVRRLEDCIAFNVAHCSEEMPLFGQELFEQARDLRRACRASDLKRRSVAERSAKLQRVARRSLDSALARCDVLLTPTGSPAWHIGAQEDAGRQKGTSSLGAIAGYPSVSLPVSLWRGALPMGVSLIGPRFSEAQLLAVACELESKLRRGEPLVPRFLATVGDGYDDEEAQ